MNEQKVDREGGGIGPQRWCEVWIDMGLDPPYVLLVLPTEKGGVIVRDVKADTVAYEGTNYESVKLWLLEDEFTQVDGRMTQEEH